jgi:excinuclease ABC subunit A
MAALTTSSVVPLPRREDDGEGGAADSAGLIRIRGARTHNLKNVDLDLPRNRFVVITGLSGSGKSSLAFDTLYAEGQRRYVESLSAYARQFLELMEKPDVDLIEGLSPAISIEQKATSHNPRSTVGTVTEIHDYLRLLYARIGDPYCPEHDIALTAQSVSQMVDHVLTLPQDTRLMILAPLIVGRKGEQADLFEELRAQGFVRIRVDGTVYELDALPKLKKNLKHTIEVVVDRLRVRQDAKQRLAESFETALRHADGRALAVEMDSGQEHLFSAKFACPVCSYSLPELEPRLFSFNNPMGACPRCDGLGTVSFFDPKRVVAFPELSLASGAIKGWDRRNQFYFQLLQCLSTHYEFDLERPFNELPESVQHAILHGSEREKVRFLYVGERGNKHVREHPFEGVLPNLERRYRETDSAVVREELSKYLNAQPCPECGGTRLRREARYIKVAGRAIYEVSKLALSQSIGFFKTLALPGVKQAIADKIVREILNRLQFLLDVGLEYLSLDRSADTLSGGEAQRIRLASQIGSGLTGVMYVLDEPSIGLHQRDNNRLVGTLEGLRDLGNTVIVVEHDTETIMRADHVVDFGPGAGKHGGKVVAQGLPADIMKAPGSITGAYLAGREQIALPASRRKPTGYITVNGARENNLKNLTVRFPLGVFCAVTGVSGAGKSSLVGGILEPALRRELAGALEQIGEHDSIDGIDNIDKVIVIDQQPIGRTPRSNPATYSKLFDLVRDVFAQTKEARAFGYGPGRFSFNVKGGRCEACEGGGVRAIEMHFLPDVFVRCEACRGKRYNDATLRVTFRGKTIADVLETSVKEAMALFENIPAISKIIETLDEVGLGYVSLGQPATTLSGGEAQRVKLARELARRDTGRTLYVLDEPTTGLHYADVKQLLGVLHRLVEAGNSVLVVEHNLDVIKVADWVIDLGPEGGGAGGQVIAEGTPEQVARNAESHTGQFLKPLLADAAPSSSGKKKQEKPLPATKAAPKATRARAPAAARGYASRHA